MVEQTNILLQYSMCYVTYSTAKMIVLVFIFVSPGDASATITQYVAQMEREFGHRVTALMYTHRAIIERDAPC